MIVKPKLMVEALSLLILAEGPLRDRFSRTKPEFQKNVSDAARRTHGQDWDKAIDKHYGQGASRRLLDQLWDKHYSDDEALDEVGFYFDNAQQGTSGYGNSGGYMTKIDVGPKADYLRDPKTGDSDIFERTARVLDPKGFEDPANHDMSGNLRSPKYGTSGGVSADDFEDL